MPQGCSQLAVRRTSVGDSLALKTGYPPSLGSRITACKGSTGLPDEALLLQLADLSKGSARGNAKGSVVTRDRSNEGIPAEELHRVCSTLREDLQDSSKAVLARQEQFHKEMKQIRERRDRQTQEGTILFQRLRKGQDVLRHQLEEQTAICAGLEGRVESGRYHNWHLQATLEKNMAQMMHYLDELNYQLAEISSQQPELLEELQSSTANQALLQEELQEERVATWHQSQEVLMSFAGHSDRGHTKPVASEDGSDALNSPSPEQLEALWTSPSSPAWRQHEELEKRRKDIQQQAVEELSSWQRRRAASVEEQAHLRKVMQLQKEKIGELRKEFALEEAARQQDSQDGGDGSQAICQTSSGRWLPASSITTARMNEAEDLRQALQERELHSHAASESLEEARSLLDARRSALSDFRSYTLESELAYEAQEAEVAELSASLAEVQEELKSCRATLEEAEQKKQAEVRAVRWEAAAERRDLMLEESRIETLESELHAPRSCLRRHQAPVPSSRH
mmetsp:Transcript_8887/g.19532  ORF Transcript_8887/g.19532 Transcript_8887/m.19532 type:complete len:511 (-) Transcript_8887:87-1619(-)